MIYPYNISLSITGTAFNQLIEAVPGAPVPDEAHFHDCLTEVGAVGSGRGDWAGEIRIRPGVSPALSAPYVGPGIPGIAES